MQSTVEWSRNLRVSCPATETLRQSESKKKNQQLERAKMADKVKVGFVGCGGIANFHFGHFEKIEDAQIVAVCDLIDERVQRTAERFGATAYKDYKEMFEKEDLDTVKFTLRLDPRSKQEFGYVLTTYHGTRTERR